MRHRLQSAPERALEHAEEKQKAETRCQPAPNELTVKKVMQIKKKLFRPSKPTKKPLMGSTMALDTR